MSLYDDAGLISLPTGAAGKDGTLYNIKPVEKLKATELVTNGDFSSDGPGSGGLVGDVQADWTNGWRVPDLAAIEGDTKIIDGVLKIINGSGEDDARAYATNGTNQGAFWKAIRGTRSLTRLYTMTALRDFSTGTDRLSMPRRLLGVIRLFLLKGLALNFFFFETQQKILRFTSITYLSKK